MDRCGMRKKCTKCFTATYENREIKKLKVCDGSDGSINEKFFYSDGTQDYGRDWDEE